MKKLIILSIMLFGILYTEAQVKVIQPSPKATISQVIGLDTFELVYSRPSKKGRIIFGGLVPYNSLWRTGANEATVFKASNDFNFGGTPVKAGEYALYTIPKVDEWEVLLYNKTDIWGAPANLDDKLVAARCIVKPTFMDEVVETFTIGFSNLKDISAQLNIVWDKTMVKIPITVDPNQAILKSIDKALAGPTANDYNRAAMYYLENNLDKEKAWAWAKKANEIKPDSFAVLKTLSEAYAAKGEYQKALSYAKKSLTLAEKAGYTSYINANKKNIKTWQSK